MTDKVEQTPAADVKPVGTPAPEKGAAPAGTPAVDVQQILAENVRLKEREAVLTKSYNEVRVFATKKAQEAAALRKSRTSDDEIDLGGAEPERRAPAASDEPDRLSAIEGRQAIIDFKLDHPDYNSVVDDKSGKTVWDTMQELLSEENPVSMTLAGATPYLTLKNAYKEVELMRLRAGAAKASAGTADEPRARLRAQAMLSGQSATEGGEVIDLKNATAEEILAYGIESGLFDGLIDTADLPLAMRKARSKK